MLLVMLFQLIAHTGYKLLGPLSLNSLSTFISTYQKIRRITD